MTEQEQPASDDGRMMGCVVLEGKEKKSRNYHAVETTLISGGIVDKGSRVDIHRTISDCSFICACSFAEAVNERGFLFGHSAQKSLPRQVKNICTWQPRSMGRKE